MDAFNDAVEKLLWPEKRFGNGSIWRTQNECALHLRKEFVPKPFRSLADEEGYLKLGPIPKNTPINLIANLLPDLGQFAALQTKLVPALIKIHTNFLEGEAATVELRKSDSGIARRQQVSRFRRGQRPLFRNRSA